MNGEKNLMMSVIGLSAAVISLTWFMGCMNLPHEISADFGQQVELRTGQSVTIHDEQLEIKFEEVIDDSRCPAGATCIWQGEVTGILKINYQGEAHNKTITQPGLTQEMVTVDFGEYAIGFNFLPYPELDEVIKPADYRLEIVVNKAVTLSGGILATFDVEGEEYRIFVRNESTIDDIFALQRGESQAAIPSGKLIGEPVFYNQPWSWYIDPMDVHMAEFTIEVCSGLPSHVENDLDYWVNTVGRFCPWSAELVEIVDYR